MDPQPSNLVCVQCQGRIFIEDGFSLVCQGCGLQVEKQINRYEDETSQIPGANIMQKFMNRAAVRKRDTIKEHVGTTKNKHKNIIDTFGKAIQKEDWSDYLDAYQKILKTNGEKAVSALNIENGDKFQDELQKAWFGYMGKWADSGVRLQGGFMEARKGCFKMSQPGKIKKRYFIGEESTTEVGSEVIKLENEESYQKIYEKDYDYLKTEFYKRKAKAKKVKQNGKKLEDSTQVV